VNDRADLSDEERKRLDAFLKVLASATSYGIFAEMNRKDLPGREQASVSGFGGDDEPLVASVTAPEEPGEYCFPPFAACVAGAARLMLALLEQCVTDLGGSYAMCETDSMAIVATEEGGLIPCSGGAFNMQRKDAVKALSWEQVEAIRMRFAALNPYNPSAVPGSILKLEDENVAAEDENFAGDEEAEVRGRKGQELRIQEVFREDHTFREDHSEEDSSLAGTFQVEEPDQSKRRKQLYCYAISSKRYVLFDIDDGRPVLRKWSEHGLGHLLNPTDPENDDRDWIRHYWEGIAMEALGQKYQWPAWLDRPAIGRITASSPQMLKPFSTWNRRKPD
jgi:hypothetical protein